MSEEVKQAEKEKERELLIEAIKKLQKENEELKEEILNFIPRSMHEVEFKTKLIKIIGETKDEE